MKDVCRCGHGRPKHASGYAGCLICGPNQRAEFGCEPGGCDRFTWKPTEEESDS